MMRRFFRLVARLLILAIIALAGVMTVNTLSFSSRQIPVEAYEPPAAPAGAERRLAGAVQFPTVANANGAIDSSAFRRLDTFLRQTYPRVDSQLELSLIQEFSRLYKWRGRNAKRSPILLMGHLDVVPPGDSSDWRHPPFSGAIADDFVWGRGTMDDKVACLGLLEATEQLLAEDFIPERTIYLAFGHDEETGGLNGAKAIVEHLSARDVQLDYVLDEGALIIRDAMRGLDRPLAMIGIAEKGYVTLSLTTSLQEGGHSSMPPGETAVGVLSAAITRLQENPFPARIDGAAKSLFRHAGPEMSPLYKTLFANLWMTEDLLMRVLTDEPASNAMVRTTTAPTILRAGVKDNVLPTTAHAKINFRILPGETVESTLKYVRQTIDDDRLRVEVDNPGMASNPSPVSGAEAFGFQVIQKTVQEIFPEAVVAPSLVVATTDARHYTALTDQVYRFLPLVLERSDLTRIHGRNERIAVGNYRQAIQFYRRLMENSCR